MIAKVFFWIKSLFNSIILKWMQLICSLFKHRLSSIFRIWESWFWANIGDAWFRWSWRWAGINNVMIVWVSTWGVFASKHVTVVSVGFNSWRTFFSYVSDNWARWSGVWITFLDVGGWSSIAINWSYIGNNWTAWGGFTGIGEGLVYWWSWNNFVLGCWTP